jgi:hypothetical protein
MIWRESSWSSHNTPYFKRAMFSYKSPDIYKNKEIEGGLST